jgi:hypothetical protein
VLGHPEGVLDAPQLVVGADHPGRFGVEDFGDVGLPASQRAGFRFEIAVDRTSAAASCLLVGSMTDEVRTVRA